MIKFHENDIPHLTEDEARAITLFKEKLKERFHVVKLILFGSKARGDYDEDSDIDLMVLVEEDKNFINRDKLSDVQFEVVYQMEVPIMSMLENYRAWEEESEDVSLPLKDNIMEDGVEIEI